MHNFRLCLGHSFSTSSGGLFLFFLLFACMSARVCDFNDDTKTSRFSSTHFKTMILSIHHRQCALHQFVFILFLFIRLPFRYVIIVSFIQFEFVCALCAHFDWVLFFCSRIFVSNTRLPFLCYQNVPLVSLKLNSNF